MYILYNDSWMFLRNNPCFVVSLVVHFVEFENSDCFVGFISQSIAMLPLFVGRIPIALIVLKGCF